MGLMSLSFAADINSTLLKNTLMTIICTIVILPLILPMEIK